MKFYLGVDRANWLTDMNIPLFVSHRTLRGRRTMPRAADSWALDSGAFTEVAGLGRFETTPAEYARAVDRYRDEIGLLDWAAPQDHMCEPWVLAKSEIANTVAAAQAWTVNNYLELRSIDDTLPIIPVLQGQTLGDYLDHVDAYTAAGVNLEHERRVGLGSVCRRQSTTEIAEIIGVLSQRLALHGFGVKGEGIARYGWMLASADSMAWSYRGRHIRPCPVRPVASCAHCRHHAYTWRSNVLDATRRRPHVQLALQEHRDLTKHHDNANVTDR